MISNVTKLVFSNLKYLILACSIFCAMLFSLLVISEYVFLSPYVVGHIPSGTELNFILIVTVSILSGLVIPMNVYRVTLLKNSKHKIGGSVFGTIIGASAGACSCGPIGLTLVSTLGTFGSVTSSFLTNYETPIRIIATGVLVLTYYTTIKSLKTECTLIKS